MLNMIEDSLNKIEKNAWDNFEVGSIDEILNSNEDSSFLSHLKILIELEQGKKNFLIEEINFDSKLKYLVLAYFFYQKLDLKISAENFESYLNQKNSLFTNSIYLFGIRLNHNFGNYKRTLSLIESYHSLNSNSNLFFKEKLDSFYHLNRYSEVVDYFKQIHKLIDKDLDIYLKVGMSLNALGKFKEAETILTLVKIEKSLPTYEDKQKEYLAKIKKISDYENKKEKLDLKELKDLGFAYLFNSQFQKAEEVFSKVITLQE